ncbi:MAG: DUF721 domain-containing protein [Acidobacteriota bacterium]
MERASKILGTTRIASRICSQEQIAHAIWRAAVGKRLAAHTNPGFLRGATLTIEVEDDVWATQLEPLKPQILRKMVAIVGTHLVRDISIAVVPRRRSMDVESRPLRHGQTRLPLLDAREQAADPVLDRIYQSSRRRALAG